MGRPDAMAGKIKKIVVSDFHIGEGREEGELNPWENFFYDDKFAELLHYLEGLGVREIAARLDLPEGTVKIRLHRARNLLRERLERVDPTGLSG